MNYYQPRQRKTDMRWDFTSMNDGHVWPVGYCDGDFDKVKKRILDCDILPNREAEVVKLEKFASKFHSNGHATCDEAVECYRQYQLDQHLRLNKHENPAELRRCAVCGTWTGHHADIGMTTFDLCDQHLGRNWVEELFKGSSNIISS
jgi:hypothetical protein